MTPTLAADADPKARQNQAKAIDVHVGARLRKARQVKRMSQTLLGDRLGVTFQQVQKYERGTNRISAGKLALAARALDRPISWFFMDMEDSPPTPLDVLQERRANLAKLVETAGPDRLNAISLILSV